MTADKGLSAHRQRPGMSQGSRSRMTDSVVVGVLATITMDAGLVLASLAGGERLGSDKIDLGLIGRWSLGLAHGRLRHPDLAAGPAVRGEIAAGLATHYLTGIVLTRLYFELARRARLGAGSSGTPARGPAATLGAATAFGAATALLPCLILYPSWGYGPFARRSADAGPLVRTMLLGHTVFGAGIGMWALLLDRRRSRR